MIIELQEDHSLEFCERLLISNTFLLGFAESYSGIR